MADIIYSSYQALENKDSFYNAIRKTGGGSTPFWESLNSGIPFKGDPSNGHNWKYRPGPNSGDGEENAYAEGSKRADITSWGTVNLKNQLQIFKKTSGITESQKQAWTIEEQKAKLSDQIYNNRKQLRLDIEKAMLSSDAPVAAASSTDIRKMAGVKHYIPANAVFDLEGATLSVKDHIDEGLKLMNINGLSGEDIVIMCGADAFTELNWYYADKNLLRQNESSIIAKKNVISTGWFEKASIEANPNLAANEILMYAPDLINPVLLRQVKDRNCSDPEYDVEVKEDLFELTLQVLDPYAALWIKNIG